MSYIKDSPDAATGPEPKRRKQSGSDSDDNAQDRSYAAVTPLGTPIQPYMHWSAANLPPPYYQSTPIPLHRAENYADTLKYLEHQISVVKGLQKQAETEPKRLTAVLYEDEEFEAKDYDLDAKEIKDLPRDKYLSVCMVKMGFHIAQVINTYSRAYPIISEIKAESAHTDAEQLSRSEAGTSVQQEEKLGLTKERSVLRRDATKSGSGVGQVTETTQAAEGDECSEVSRVAGTTTKKMGSGQHDQSVSSTGDEPTAQ